MGFITDRCRELRTNATFEEKSLWESLRKRRRKGYRFLRQFPLVIASRQNKSEFYIADFYCSEAKLVIEVDGGYHGVGDQQQDDVLRDKILLTFGLKTLRFTNEQITRNLSSVLEQIDNALDPPQPSL